MSKKQNKQTVEKDLQETNAFLDKTTKPPVKTP